MNYQQNVDTPLLSYSFKVKSTSAKFDDAAPAGNNNDANTNVCRIEDSPYYIHRVGLIG